MEPHIAVAVTMLPDPKRASPAAASLFRNGSFDYPVICEDAGGLLKSWHLSPFAAWARLRCQRGSNLIAQFKHSRRELVCVCPDESMRAALNSAFKGPMYSHVADIPPLPANKAGRVVFDVGLKPGDLQSLRSSGRNVLGLALLAINAAELQACLKFLLDRFCDDAPVAEVRLFLLLHELQEALSGPARGFSTLPAAESEEGQRTIKNFLLGKGPLPDEDSYIQRGTAARAQETILVDALQSKLDLKMAPAMVTAHALLPGMGTTTMLQRVAHTLRMRPKIFATVLGERGEASQVVANAGSSHIALLIASPVRQAERDRHLIFKALKTHRAQTQAGAVLLQVLVHEPGDTISYKEMYLDPLLQVSEAERFVGLYSLFFPQFADDLCHLAGDDTWVGLPGLFVSDGCHGSSHRTVDHLKETLKWGMRYDTDKLQFLAQLAALELFAAGGHGLRCNAGLQGGNFSNIWHVVLENPEGPQHRLRSIVWAIPLLRSMADLDVRVAPETSSGFKVDRLSKSALRLSALMHDALLSLVMSNVPLVPWLEKWYNRDGRSCNPRWLLLVEEAEGHESVTTLLQSLVTDWQQQHDSSHDKLKGSFVQASVLLAQQRQKRGEWALGLEVLNHAVEEAEGDRSDFIARLNRGRHVSSGVAAGHAFDSDARDTCVKDFRAALEGIPPESFNPGISLDHAIDKLKRKGIQDGMSMDAKAPAAQLYFALSQLRGDDHSAPPTPGFAEPTDAPLQSEVNSTEASARRAPPRRFRRPSPTPTPSPLLDETQVAPAARLNHVLNAF
jgi:hypothetical protein